MSRTAFFSILLSLYYINSMSQGISGRVIDSLTMEPISFVHIYVRSDLGTISNENGDFALNTKMDKTDTLFLSHVGYKQKMILKVPEINEQVIHLSPISRLLNEVVVYDRDYTNRLVDAIYNQLKKTDQPNFGKAFYRQVTSNNGEPTEIREIFFDVSYSSTGIKKYSSKEARFAEKKSSEAKPIASMGNHLYLTLGLDIAPVDYREFKKPFNKNYRSDIDFTITEEYSSKNENFLVISYQSINEPLDQAMVGKITVKKRNNCICRYEGTTRNSLGMDTLRFKQKSKNLLISNHLYSWDVGFNCNNDSNPSLIYLISRSSFEAPIFDKIEANSKFIIYEDEGKKTRKLKEYTLSDKDMDLINNTKYHPNFWKNNEIIKRTALEDRIVESFEKSNSFGTYFLK